ncbi:hypothetical protein [uncultured Sphingomonas sp.]|uniref:hypothetical protein n=1 Tax=uncultured Sphingomonas sp. TaxID=158754 RepID=UPI00262407BC|nr:hypothetical protein [uncultured Sphingomonas sp.]
MHEYEDIADPDNVAQGDVIEWLPPRASAPWRIFGVVVTADCDLVWKKHDGVVSYVPAMPARDFVWHSWRPTYFAKHQPKLMAEAAKRLNTWRAKQGSMGELTASAVRDWLARAGVDGLLDELGATDKGQRNGLRPPLEKLLAVETALACETPDLPLLRRAHEATNQTSAANAAILVREVQNVWSGLPGDVYHLPSTPEGEEGGLFLLLRHIRQLGVDEITGRPGAVRAGEAHAKRVARVRAPFRYAITQSLAKVFADIGLPDDHDIRKKDAAARLFESWS